MFEIPEIGEAFYVAPMIAYYNAMNADHIGEGDCIPTQPGWYVNEGDWLDGPYDDDPSVVRA